MRDCRELTILVIEIQQQVYKPIHSSKFDKSRDNAILTSLTNKNKSSQQSNFQIVKQSTLLYLVRVINCAQRHII